MFRDRCPAHGDGIFERDVGLVLIPGNCVSFRALHAAEANHVKPGSRHERRLGLTLSGFEPAVTKTQPAGIGPIPAEERAGAEQRPRQQMKRLPGLRARRDGEHGREKVYRVLCGVRPPYKSARRTFFQIPQMTLARSYYEFASDNPSRNDAHAPMR
jgi:hypothetical protein